jgi:hypothetical protein
MRDETKTKQRVSRTTLRHIKVKRLNWYKIENGGTKSTPLNLPLFVWYHLFSDHKSLLVYVESCDWIGCPSPQFCLRVHVFVHLTGWNVKASSSYLRHPNSKIEEMEKMENYLFLAQSKIFLLLFYEKKNSNMFD